MKIPGQEIPIVFHTFFRYDLEIFYIKRQLTLPLNIAGCAQTHKETRRFVRGAILTADFIKHTYRLIFITPMNTV